MIKIIYPITLFYINEYLDKIIVCHGKEYKKFKTAKIFKQTFDCQEDLSNYYYSLPYFSRSINILSKYQLFSSKYVFFDFYNKEIDSQNLLKSITKPLEKNKQNNFRNGPIPKTNRNFRKYYAHLYRNVHTYNEKAYNDNYKSIKEETLQDHGIKIKGRIRKLPDPDYEVISFNDNHNWKQFRKKQWKYSF